MSKCYTLTLKRIATFLNHFFLRPLGQGRWPGVKFHLTNALADNLQKTPSKNVNIFGRGLLEDFKRNIVENKIDPGSLTLTKGPQEKLIWKCCNSFESQCRWCFSKSLHCRSAQFKMVKQWTVRCQISMQVWVPQNLNPNSRENVVTRFWSTIHLMM